MISERVQQLLVRARNAFRLRDYATADQLVDEMLTEYPESIAGHILKGIILGRTGRNRDAIRVFRRALELDPVNAEAFNNIAVSLRQEGQLHQALRAVQKAEDLFGERADILYNKGNILKDLGQIDEAIGAYRKALEVDPRYVLAYNNLGTLYHGRGEINRAIETFGQGLAIDPNHPTLRYNLGLAYEESGKLAEAEAQYERSLKSRPGWSEALNNLGIVYQKQERFSEADRTFREILTINQQDPRANNNLATNFALQGRTREAMQFYRQALQSDPSYSRAAGNLGRLIDHTRDVENTIDELQQLADLDTDNVDLQYRLAVALSRTDRHEAAERVLLRILAIDPAHIEAIRLLADVYMRSGRDGEAERCYRRLLTLNADYAEHHVDRARVYQRRGEPDRALAEIERYLDARGGELEGLLVKASILVDLDRQAEALSMLEELRSLYLGDGRVLAAIASAHQKSGEREAAVRAVDELINLQGSRATPEDIEALNESLELYEKAVDAFAEEYQLDWERNLSRFSELAQTPDETEEQELDVDEQVSLDEDSIPILSFGGEELLEPEEWEVQVRDDDDNDEEEYLGVEPAEELAPSLTTLPDQQQMRGGEAFAEGLRPRYDDGGIAPSPSPPDTGPTGYAESPPFAQPPQQPPQPQPALPRQQPESPGGGPVPFPGPGSPGGTLPGTPQWSGAETSDGAWPRDDSARGAPSRDEQPPSPWPEPGPPDASEPDARSESPPAGRQGPPSQPRPWAPGYPTASAAASSSGDGSEQESEEDALVDLPDDFEVVEDESFEPPEEPEVTIGEDADLPEEEPARDEDRAAADELADLLEKRDEPDQADEETEEEPVPTIDDLLGEPLPTDESDEPARPAEPAEPVQSAGPAEPTPEPDRPHDDPGPAGLLDYLSTMVEALPADRKTEYMASEERLKLEYLRAQLAGRHGLHREGERYAPQNGGDDAPPTITRKRLSDTLTYIGTISEYHPDRGIGLALKHRVTNVLAQLRELREDKASDRS